MASLIDMPRHYRRSGMAPVIQSFKKVLNFAPASRAAGANITASISVGQDSVAAGQISTNDPNVPTGSIIKFFEIQWSLGNLTDGNNFLHCTIQRTHSGQSTIAANVVGGSPQRNQVFMQRSFQLGDRQSGSRTYRFKVPKKFQRVREGDAWFFTRTGNAVYTDALQVIFKFYR